MLCSPQLASCETKAALTCAASSDPRNSQFFLLGACLPRRKNFLFVGGEDAGENVAGLYSLVATCEANEVNPIAYLTDVLLRVSTHPADRIDELLPDAWKPAQES